MWWEKRGGGTAEGATRCETCAVSAATAARRRELAGREPQCEQRSRLQSCDRPESLVSPPPPQSVPITPTKLHSQKLHIPECHETQFIGVRTPATRETNTNPSMLCASPRGSRNGDPRPGRKWVGHRWQLEKERRRPLVFRGGVSSRPCRMGEERLKSGIAHVFPVHPHPGHEGMGTRGP